MASWLLAICILSADPAAQTDHAPSEADEVYVCKFESDSDRNYDRWPDQWTRRRGKGYPIYVPIEIVPDELDKTSQNHCLRLQLDGGAAQAYSPSIPIIPQFSYQFNTRLRTRGLVHDVVSCSLSFFDGQDKLLETHESQVFQRMDEWTEIRIGPITPSGDRVRSAVVAVHLRPSGEADLTGEAFLDDVWVGRLPKMLVDIPGDHGIFQTPKDLLVHCRVSGFKNERPAIRFELLDVHGNPLESAVQTMHATAEVSRLRLPSGGVGITQRQGFAGECTWRPPVKEPGFYTVRVSTPGHSGLLMSGTVNFVLLPPLARSKVGEFGWSLPTGDQPISIRSLPVLLSQAGVHWVKFPVWFPAKETKRAEEISWFAERLSSFDIALVGLLDRPPAEVRELLGMNEDMPVAAAFADKSVWLPALDPIMTRLSLKVRWWQLGRDDDSSFASYPDLPGKLKEVYEDLASFGQRVNVGVPWKAGEERPVAANPVPWMFYSCLEDLPFTAQEIQAAAEGWPKDHAKRWLILTPLSKREYGLDTRARDLIERMLAAKITKADAVFVPDPFDDDHGLMRPDGSPGELLLPWRTTALLVGGSDYLGSLGLAGASDNHVFTQGTEAVMVLWNDHPTEEQIFLGESIRVYDMWGREHPAPPVEVLKGTRQQTFAVDQSPLFITGISAPLMKWRMSFQFDNPRLASVFAREQTVRYHFTNPFTQGVGGRIKFHLPHDWKVEGGERQFKVGPGETYSDALRVQLGADANSGIQPVRVDFEITADRSYQFSLAENLWVGLGDVTVSLETRIDDNGNLVVDQHLVNNTDKFVSFKCYLTAPGRRRERQQVFNLGRGRTTNTYVFPNGRELVGETLFFRAEEIDGVRVLNDQAVVVP